MESVMGLKLPVWVTVWTDVFGGHEVRHLQNGFSVSLCFSKTGSGFLAKNETPDDHPQPIVISHLTDFATDDQSRKLCPMRALRIYLSRMENIRNGRKRFFLPIKKGKTDITKASVARRITEAILLTYRLLSERSDLRKIMRVNTHEVRAVSTSWSYLHNCSLKDVMAAAFWRS